MYRIWLCIETISLASFEKTKKAGSWLKLKYDFESDSTDFMSCLIFFYFTNESNLPRSGNATSMSITFSSVPSSDFPFEPICYVWVTLYIQYIIYYSTRRALIRPVGHWLIFLLSFGRGFYIDSPKIICSTKYSTNRPTWTNISSKNLYQRKEKYQPMTDWTD